MDINPLKAFVPDRTERNQSNGSDTPAPGVFGKVMEAVSAESPLQFAAPGRLNAQTHSFSELPLIVPIRADEPQAPSEDSTAMRKSDNPETVITPAGSELPETVTEFQQKIVQSVTEMQERSPSFARAAQASAVTEQAGIGQVRPSLTAPTLIDQPSVSKAAPVANQRAGAARNIPLHVHIARGNEGLMVEIRLPQLDDEDRRDLTARIADLASEYGLAIDQIRISSFGRRL